MKLFSVLFVTIGLIAMAVDMYLESMINISAGAVYAMLYLGEKNKC